MAFVNNNYVPSGNVFVVSGNAWTGVGSITGAVTGSVAVTNTVTVQPLVGSVYGIGVGSIAAAIISPATIGSLATQGVIGSVAVTNTVTVQPLIGSVYGIGAGSIAAAIISPSTIGSLATQGVIGSVAVSNFPATQSVSVSGIPTFIPSGNNYIGAVSGAFSATINSAYIPSGNMFALASGTSTYVPLMAESGAAGTPQRLVVAASLSAANVYVPSGNFYGMGSGTTSFNPIMVESGAAGTPQRVVVAATLSAANVFVQSGNAWAGVGSITGAITGSVAVTNTVTTQPLIGSVYGIGVGSIAAAIISPATIGSLATQGIIGSVAVTNTVTVQPLIGSVYGIGAGSIAAAIISPSSVGSLAVQTVNGSVIMLNGIPPAGSWWQMGSEYSTAQTDTVIVQSGGAGISHYITDIYFNTSVGSQVFTIEDGTSTPRFKYYGQLPGDGVSKNFVVPIKIGSNSPVTFTTSAAGSVFVSVNGYTA